ncbi:origin recognition complex subunit 2-domain-containing protein [Pisolithus orientalis]|uniref:origin recognition complex subunit 2-domain-containing protein n=1 Tax=Pisolithus orientalis TaxID=936130 RepID=UPI002223F5A2|nr:origin recognition complex subunit 2-domain-containing protein [Pisolithus orientalis]KAI6002246.1 origin recognition complex subunit 2-domain-containing protein [Pisolithus orientalis]
MDSDDRSDGEQRQQWDESELGAPGVAASTPSFEAYFLQASSRSATSSNVFSSRVLPLSADEYAAAIAAYKARPQGQTVQTRWTGPWDEATAFRRYARELAEGFNLLFYGFGSKRAILNKLATECLAKKGHVVVVNGFQPNTTLKDILASIERVPGVLSHSSSLPLSAEQLRSQKIRNFLSLLALNPNVHLVASIDRLNAPLLWSASDVSSRKSPAHNPGDMKSSVLRRGYAWLWHDLTTLSPYDFELTTGTRTARQGITAGGNASGGPLSETAVAHVLAAVTAKAKKLFAFLAAKQLENIETAPAENATDLQQYGLTYDTLFSAARAEFIATNDTTLRSLLGEFMDHGLILSVNQGGSGGGETLWIPLRKERIAKILQSVNEE